MLFRSPTTVDCTVTDAAGATATGSFTVTVTNNAPTFTPPADITLPATSAAGAPVTFTAAGNDVEDGAIPAVCTPASGATFPLGPTTVECTVTDRVGATASGSFTVTVTNNPPVATPGSMTTAEDTAAAGTVTSTDIDGLAPTYALVSNASHGTVALSAAGAYTYTPAPNYFGPDAFTFSVDDGRGGTDTAVVSITVTPVNDAPVANDDAYTTAEDTALVVAAPGLRANDVDVDSADPAVVVVTGPAHGTLALAPGGGFTYTPAPNYFGPDSFTYRLNDGEAVSNVATVSLLVTPVNDDPVCTAATPSQSLWPPNHKFVPILIGGVTDVEGDAITIAVSSIFQDEPVGSHSSGATEPDASGVGTSTAMVRAERAGDPKMPGDGRFYHIAFTATDAQGGSCTGVVKVAIPHDQSGKAPVDSGPLYNSLIAPPRR